ncbi:hypothetical protein V1514DRAFT_286036 [Lipomyces japonicus]|uniref:uncharacterized protein n=1 Tax=Lipomyces japonicus TaxID=56871 RepID=UPI0034CEF61D
MEAALHFPRTGLLEDLPTYLKHTMVPSYIFSYPKGTESGTYFAIDIGGSTLKLGVTRFSSNGPRKLLYATSLPLDDSVKNLDGQSFFRWVASQLQSVQLKAESYRWIEEGSVVCLGVTWSFPLQQTSASSAKILRMGKGFSSLCDDIIGWDLADSLISACADLQVPIKVIAIVNDSVATILSHLHTDPECQVGAIVGTGVNAAIRLPTNTLYEERFSEFSSADLEKCEYCVINSELSFFGGDGILPKTKWDVDLEASIDGPSQPFELMTSGLYMAELARSIIEDKLLNFRPLTAYPSDLRHPYGLEASTMGMIEGELDLEFARQMFLAKHPCKQGRLSFTLEDMKFMKSTFYAISSRAAAIVAAGLMAIAITTVPQTSKPSGSDVVVGVTGSVFLNYPRFYARVQEFLNLLGRRRGRKVRLAPLTDAGIWGASVAAVCNDF